MTANFTEPSLLGRRNCCPAGCPRQSGQLKRKNQNEATHGDDLSLGDDRVEDVVNDQIGRRVDQQQVLADHSVLEGRVERGSVSRSLRWHARQRLTLGILRVDREWHRSPLGASSRMIA